MAACNVHGATVFAKAPFWDPFPHESIRFPFIPGRRFRQLKKYQWSCC